MHELQAFERRLTQAFEAYANDAPIRIDVVSFVDGIVETTSKVAISRVVRTPARHVAQRRTTRSSWLLLAAAIALATVVVLAAAGGIGPLPGPLLDSPTATAQATESTRPTAFAELATPNAGVPAALGGRWTGLLFGQEYTLASNGGPLVIGPGGRAFPELGRARGVVAAPIGAPNEDPTPPFLQIDAPEPCGDARYLVQGTYAGTHGLVQTSLPDGPFDVLELIPIADPCEERVRYLTGTEWSSPSPGLVLRGVRYGSATFTEPFTFTMQEMSGGGVMTEWGGPNVLALQQGCCWWTFFVDDVPVNRDPCDLSKGRLPNVPASPAEVEAWLRSSARLVINDVAEVPVDGRMALRFDFAPSDECIDFIPTLAPPGFLIGQRLYAIPTGDDTILYTLWADAGSLGGVLSDGDLLVRSMDFE